VRLAIFGATGATGRLLVQQALGGGHALNVLARDPARITANSDQLRVVAGDVRDVEAVRHVVDGVEGVISVLGQTHPPTPDLLVTGARNIIAAMHSAEVRRLVYLTGAGVWDTQDQRTFTRKLIRGLMYRFAREVLRDSEAAVQAIKSSDLQWTIVRVPRLTDAPRTGKPRVTLSKPAGMVISRADVAAFLLCETLERRFVNQLPFVTS
jgi:putative NADH-flavin reductase